MSQESKPPASAAIDLDELAELERRWAAIEAGEATIPHDELVRWLETWGTPAFRPSRDR
jgi:predicted transcriptional regulator